MPKKASSPPQHYLERGVSLITMAKEEGISYDAARARCNRAGVRLPVENTADVRLIAQRMETEDAVEYLLDLVESLMGLTSDYVHPVQSKIPAGQQQRVFCMLHANLGKTVRRETMYDVLWSHLEDPPLDPRNNVGVVMCRLREAVAEHFKITTIRGIGWAMEEV